MRVENETTLRKIQFSTSKYMRNLEELKQRDTENICYYYENPITETVRLSIGTKIDIFKPRIAKETMKQIDKTRLP